MIASDNPQAKQKRDLIQKEMARKANDEILVHNPTPKDYHVRWGGNYWKVISDQEDSGHGTGNTVLPRYLARKYVKEMKDKLIRIESNTIVKKAKKRYTGAHWPAEEERVALRVNNPTLIKKYYKILWKGLYKRFGLDEIPRSEEDKMPSRGGVAVDETLLDELEANEQLIEPKVSKEEEKPETEADVPKEKPQPEKEELVKSIAI